jgi:excisionase family DNA binding protein
MWDTNEPIMVEKPQWARATFNLPEVAQMLGCSRSSVYRWASEGEIPTIRIGRRVLVPREALEQLLGGELELGPE